MKSVSGLKSEQNPIFEEIFFYRRTKLKDFNKGREKAITANIFFS